MDDGQLMTADAFLALHRGPRPLVLPNVWDAASARAFADAGFPALATSSSAIAAVLGYPDGERMPPGDMFAAVARIAGAVEVPVTADVEAGYGLPAGELVDRLLATGAVGCNLEDTDHATRTLRDPQWQADRLAAVRAASGPRLVLNARVDTFVRPVTGDPVQAAIDRGRRYRDAGADCVYPILAPPHDLPALVAGIAAPVNAMYRPGGPAPAELGALGAARISFGGGLHRRIADATAGLAAEMMTLASPG